MTQSIKTMLIIDGLQYCNYDRGLFEDMRRGGLDCAHVTVAYHENCAATIRNLGRWNRLFHQHRDLIVPVGSAAEILAAKKAGKTGILFGFQNCTPIEEDYDLIEIFHQLNVRFMQLTYNRQTALAGGCYDAQDAGVTRAGREVIAEMNRVGMVVDMSHSGARSTLDAIEYSARPIAITHANPAFFADVPRNKSAEVLRALGASGGILGFSLYPPHLKNIAACTLTDFCNMAAATAAQIGAQHLAIGSDLCSGWPDSVVEWMRGGRNAGRPTDESPARAQWPPPLQWFQTCADYPNLQQGLAAAGFAPAEIAGIMGGNWLAFFEKSFAPQTD